MSDERNGAVLFSYLSAVGDKIRPCSFCLFFYGLRGLKEIRQGCLYVIAVFVQSIVCRLFIFLYLFLVHIVQSKIQKLG